MQNLFISKKFQKFSASFLLAAAFALLTGCGDGGGVGAGGGPTGGGPTGGTTPPPPVTAVPSLSIALTDSAGATVTSISSGNPAIAKATVLTAAGAPVPNAVVTFNTDATLTTLTPVSGTALTDASGVASVTLNPASISAAGAATITATSQVGTAAVSSSVGFSLGATSLTISAPSFGVNPLSALGTTSVSVTVSSGGAAVTTPQTVTFSSSCATSGKADLTVSVTTVAGIALASYRDKGCAGTDTVTASVSGSITSSATLTVQAPNTGSIQFVSATPPNLSLKGTGGDESAQVIFKVLDTGGNPLGGKTVTFALSTNVGGITLFPVAPSTAISGSDGTVVAIVNTGTVSTPVRVTAATPGAGTVTLSTQSDRLTITTGIPDQNSFSFAATTLNIEGWDIDGTTTVLTARLADHFNNPAPDGTPVNFTTEGGSIIGSCSTVAGGCSSTLTSQQPRPVGGRVTVLAYAVGEESFTDLDGDGWADLGNELIISAISTDMPEAFVDYNRDGSRDPATEPYIDFNGNGTFDPVDGKFNGVLCNETAGSAAGTCSVDKSIHVRGTMEIVFSGSNPVISQTSPLATIDLGSCNTSYVNAIIFVRDVNNNPMPAGTTIAFTTTNGTLAAPTSFVVPNTSKSPPASYLVSIKADGTVDTTTTPSTCTDPTGSGILWVTVTVPSGLVTSAPFAVLN